MPGPTSSMTLWSGSGGSRQSEIAGWLKCMLCLTVKS